MHSPDAPIDAAWLAARPFSLDIGNQRVPVRASLDPFYDRAGTRRRR
jgi:hypothetical protein